VVEVIKIPWNNLCLFPPPPSSLPPGEREIMRLRLCEGIADPEHENVGKKISIDTEEWII
jgi:hypothetical protein